MLTQAEAETLIAMEKTFIHPATISIPPGTDQTHELIGSDKRELFLFDLWRGIFRLSKLRYQTRGRKIIVLVRLDVNAAPHSNPDGNKIVGTQFIATAKAMKINGPFLSNMKNLVIHQIFNRYWMTSIAIAM